MNTFVSPSPASRSVHGPLHAAFVLTVLSAVRSVPGPAACAEPPATPPAFPDSVHVTRGCYLSTAAYLARFQDQYPAESAWPLTVAPRNFGGPHTLAVLTWQGRWWARDEYVGVFALDCPVTSTTDVHRLRDRAEHRIRSLAKAQLKAGRILGEPDALVAMPLATREREIAQAVTLIPCTATVIRVRCRGREVPFLLFQAGAHRIAVYDPATGTATVECEPTDPLALVQAVAKKLGYPVDRGPASTPPLAGSGR